MLLGVVQMLIIPPDPENTVLETRRAYGWAICVFIHFYQHMANQECGERNRLTVTYGLHYKCVSTLFIESDLCGDVASIQSGNFVFIWMFVFPGIF